MSQATLALEEQQSQTTTAKHRFDASLGTRTASEQVSQNERVFERTQEYDELMVKEQAFEQQVQRLRQEKLVLEQDLADTEQSLLMLEQDILPIKEADDRRIELRIFLYRLALTLPLLVLAFYLFKRHRHSRYFPFVWGFIGFALFAFFVELVPYLPSYGGYVRYGVGIVMTLVVGHYAIGAMYRYLERKHAEEALPSKERASLDYELAHTRLAKAFALRVSDRWILAILFWTFVRIVRCSYLPIAPSVTPEAVPLTAIVVSVAQPIKSIQTIRSFNEHFVRFNQ